MKQKEYVVTKIPKNGLYYCHQRDNPFGIIPGSLSAERWIAVQYAKKMCGEPNHVKTIERLRAERSEQYNE